MRPRALSVSTILAITVASCSAPTTLPPSASLPVSATTLPFAGGFLDGITWLPDGRIVFGYMTLQNGVSSGTHLWAVHSDGSDPTQLSIDPGVQCTRTETLVPLAMSNGDLSYQLRCAPGAKGPFTYRTAIMSLNSAGRSTTLMPLVDLPFIPRQAAWSPDASRGLLAGGSKICEGIVRVDGTGTHPWSLGLGAGASAFDVADFVDSVNDCTRTGNADLPAWSSDGQSVAFFASAAVVGLSGQARLDAAWMLVTVDGSLSHPNKVLDGVVDPLALGWSPNGRWLAFAGTIDGRKGAWLLEPATARLVRISDASSWLDLAWSADGTQLAGLRDDAPLGGERAARIVVFDVAGLTSPSPSGA